MKRATTPPSDDIRIVTLPEDRWEEYREIRLAALTAEPTAFAEPFARAAERPPEEWRERLAGDSNWLTFAERDDRLIGLAGAFTPTDEPGVVFVVSVYVDAAFRGRGVGRKLLTSLLDRVAATSDASTLRLWVNDTNTPAIALYGSLGFKVVGAEKDALKHDGRSYDELVMERPLRDR